jgi:hypothetical protein
MRSVRPTDIEVLEVYRVFSPGRDHALLVRRRRIRLRTGEEARSHRHALRAKAQCCDKATTIGDPARGDHWDRPNDVDNCRQQYR